MTLPGPAVWSFFCPTCILYVEASTAFWSLYNSLMWQALVVDVRCTKLRTIQRLILLLLWGEALRGRNIRKIFCCLHVQRYWFKFELGPCKTIWCGLTVFSGWYWSSASINKLIIQFVSCSWWQKHSDSNCWEELRTTTVLQMIMSVQDHFTHFLMNVTQ